MRIDELIGLLLIGYGIWFTIRGVRIHQSTNKNWWRPPGGKQRYPYPITGILMGIFFVMMGLVFVLHNAWRYAPTLGYVGGGLFILLLVIGIVQPRFCHPRWYGELEDRVGRKRVEQLKRAARQMDNEEWAEIAASEASFNAWVAKKAPRQPHRQRGYKRSQ